jgi:hypothetical protein
MDPMLPNYLSNLSERYAVLPLGRHLADEVLGRLDAPWTREPLSPCRSLHFCIEGLLPVHTFSGAVGSADGVRIGARNGQALFTLGRIFS